MEVHAHTLSPRKKWTHYLWEFLMLFLAVFCGFLAENIRERISENEKAKQLAESLYKEVYADSVIVQQNIDSRLKEKERDIAHFIDYVRDSSLTNLSDYFYSTTFNGFLRNYHFEPKDGILSQLRNSGALRYFKSSLLQELIGQLSVAIANVKTRNIVESDFIITTSRPFLLKHFDYYWWDVNGIFKEEVRFKNRNDSVKPAILNPSQFNKEEAVNIGAAYLGIVISTRHFVYSPYAVINHQLLEALRKEYHLE